MNFSAQNRPAFIRQLQADAFDLLVIGGGITGAGIALDAAARGMKVALIEKDDFAFGTSSRSTKLIHGGLRYLKQLEFALVKEVGSERAIVHRLAPHLVVPEKMLLPLYQKRGLGYWLTSIGLKVYDLLAGVGREDQRKMLTRQQTLQFEPLLKADDVHGGAIYAEYRTDDARLTIELVKKAAEHGACCVNYVQGTGFTYRNGRLQGLRSLDRQTGQSFEVAAAAIVNAAGPWVDELREIDQSKTGKQLRLTKGVHIVVPFHRLPVRQAIYFDVPDGRMIFAIPRGRTTYIGTTDTEYHLSKDQVFTTAEDARYLLDAVNVTFPSALLTLADIESSWAGLRPLIHEEGKSASELSRKDEIFESPSGLISIAGGKLTGYRKMAERVVNRVIEKYFASRQFQPCATQHLTLPGGAFANSTHITALTQKLAGRLGDLNIRGNEAANLVHLFGTQSAQIVDYLEAHRSPDAEADLIFAKAWFCITFEMAVDPTDFVVRRSGLLYFNRPKMLRYADAVVDFFARQLHWDVPARAAAHQKLTGELKAVQNF